MSQTIRWKIPSSVLTNPQTTNTIKIYRSASVEDDASQYQLIDSISAGGGNSVSTYTDSGGAQSYFYYVTYTIAGGSEGSRVLALIEPTIVEQRLAEQVQGKLPEIVAARIDANLIDIRKALRNGLDIMNAYAPQTSYGYGNLPGRFEGPLIILSMSLLYMEHQLQVGIRDYTYGGTGINLQVDRNSKFASTLAELNKSINGLLAFVKMADWPDPLGLGSEAMGTPQARTFSFLFGQGSN